MKKLLAYIFLSIGFCIFVPSHFLYAQYSGMGGLNQYQKAVDEANARERANAEAQKNLIQTIISDKKSGYFNTGGTLIEKYADSPGGEDLKGGESGNVYYVSNGKGLVIEYDKGERGVVDATEANTGFWGPSYQDQIKNVYYLKDGNLVKESNVTVTDSFVRFNNDGDSAKKWVYSIAKANGLAGDVDDAGAFYTSLKKDANLASFKSENSYEDRQRAVVADDKSIIALNGEIESIQKQLVELKKDPEANAEEIVALENQLKDKVAEHDKLKGTRSENVAAITAMGTASEKALTTPNPDNFASLGLCGQWMYNVTAGKFWGSGAPEWDLKGCMAAFVNLGIQVVSVPFTWSSGLLDYVTNFTVRDFGIYFSKGGKLYDSVNNIWQLMKNICNIFFIVALVYIAIKTMLNADGFQEKQRLINVIIFAFLINFSMFFTKVMIDVSNTASLQVFNILAQTANKQTGLSDVNEIARDASKGAPVAAATVDEKSLATVFLANMKIQRFVVNASGGGLGFGNLNNGYILTYGLFSIIFIVVATIVIAVIAGMMTIRFLILVLLLMTSPIAYIGTFAPSVIATYSQLWWQKLKDNLTFLPVLMLMFYITMQFTQFATAQVTTNANDYISLIFAYIMTIAMLVISLSVAKSVGGSAGAADFGSKWAKAAIGGATFGLAARVGRRTIGAGGGAILNNSVTRRLAASNSMIGRAIGGSLTKAGKNIEGASFDARNSSKALSGALGEGEKGGIEKTRKDQEKAYKDALEATKKDNELSDSERYKKMQADAVMVAATNQEKVDKANEDKDRAQQELDQVAESLGSIQTNILQAEAEINAEKVKVEADIALKFEQEEKDHKAKLAQHEKDAADTTKTADERIESRKKANEHKSELSKIDDKKSIEVNNELAKKVGAQLKSLDDYKKNSDKLTERANELGESIGKSEKDIKDSSAQMQKIAEDMQKKGLDVMGADGKIDKTKFDKFLASSDKYKAYSDKLKTKEDKLKKAYDEHLNNATGSFVGFFTGRNKVAREAVLKAMKESQKSPVQKEIEKMMNEAAKAESDAAKDADKDKGK